MASCQDIFNIQLYNTFFHRKPLPKLNPLLNTFVTAKLGLDSQVIYQQFLTLSTDAKDTTASVGVIVYRTSDNAVLCGMRSDNKLICGSGGNIQEGETPAQAAIRETQEEFGVTPLNLKRLGQITGFENGKYGEPIIYLCTEHEGEPRASKEIRHPDFFPMDEFEPEGLTLFPPFAESLKLLEQNTQNPLVNTPEYGIMKHGDGGPGSGRYPEGSGDNMPTEQQKKTLDGVLIGSKTSDGVEVKSISEHAYQRIVERGYGGSHIKGVLASVVPTAGNTADTRVYEKKGMKVVINYQTGKIVSVIRKERRRQE
jgi:8-oxo-dGTP pyrophosphatase MutT (NUDIX family)